MSSTTSLVHPGTRTLIQRASRAALTYYIYMHIRMCIYIYMYVYIYICIFIYICIYVYVNIYIYKYKHVCVCLQKGSFKVPFWSLYLPETRSSERTPGQR